MLSGQLKYCTGTLYSNVKTISMYVLYLIRRTSKNTLELCEESLDVNLLGNVLNIHFQNASLLPHVEIFETSSSVVVLAATTNSVHRFVFPHPNRLQRHVSSVQCHSDLCDQGLIPD